MAITPLPAAPSRAVPSTFSTLADAFLAALSTFVTEANALQVDVNAKQVTASAAAVAAAASAVTADSYSDLAQAAANFKGAWSALTGSAAIPYSVSHLGRYWMLITATSNIAADVPGTSAKWQEIGNVPLQDYYATVRKPDQGVAMTAAASGSNGIAVADDDDIDYGTGNFFGVIPVLLADYTPDAEVVLEQKTDGTNGREFTLQTNGKLRVTINTTDYNSTVATGCTDNTKHVFGYSVTRETAASAGSIIFVVDGVQLGNAVAITAGAPTTINNAVSQYVLGTSATRTAGIINGYISGNRALTAAEHLALYRNGISEANKWGSQTPIYTSDFSAGVDGCTTVTGSTVTGNIDQDADGAGVPPSNDWLRCERTDATSGDMRIMKSGILTSLKYNLVKITIFNPLGSSITHFAPAKATNPASNGVTAVAVAEGTEATIIYQIPATLGTSCYMWSTNAAGEELNYAQGTKFYIKNLETYYAGATLALEDGGIQPAGANSQWLGSANNLNATLPAAGATNTRKIDSGRYVWSTVMTDDTTWTSILPAGFVLEKVIFNNSTANACELRLGTSAGGTEMAATITIAASTFTTATIDKVVSLTADTTLYLSDTGAGWNSASLTATLFFRRFN